MKTVYKTAWQVLDAWIGNRDVGIRHDKKNQEALSREKDQKLSPLPSFSSSGYRDSREKDLGILWSFSMNPHLARPMGIPFPEHVV